MIKILKNCIFLINNFLDAVDLQETPQDLSTRQLQIEIFHVSRSENPY